MSTDITSEDETVDDLGLQCHNTHDSPKRAAA